MHIEKKVNTLSEFKSLSYNSFFAMSMTTYALSHQKLSFSNIELPFIKNDNFCHFIAKKHINFLSHQKFIQRLYQKRFLNWIHSYIHYENKSNVCKKIKTIFVSFLLEHVKVYSNELLNDASHLAKSNYELDDLFINSPQRFKLYQDFLRNDFIANKKNITKIYKDFEDLGLWGKTFNIIDSPKFKILGKLQNYKLSNQDILEIEKLTKENYKNGSDFIGLTEENKEEYLNIIKNNIHHIEYLKLFFISHLDDTISSYLTIKSIVDFILHIEKTKKFLDVLENQLPIKNENTELNKI